MILDVRSCIGERLSVFRGRLSYIKVVFYYLNRRINQPPRDYTQHFCSSAMEDDLQEFLRSRDVPEEDIILMKRDKVGNIS